MSEATEDELREELVDLLQRHDWYYERAASAEAWRAGHATWQRICALVKLVPNGREIYGQYCPKMGY